MKALVKKVVLTITICLSPVFFMKPALAKEFVAAAVSNYAPYSFYTEEKGWQGYGIDLVKRMIQTPTNEHSISYMVDPNWSRALKSIEMGTLNFLWEVSYTQERAEYMEYVGVTDVQRMGLVVSEDIPFPPTIDNMDQFAEFVDILTGEDRFIVYSPDFFHSLEFEQRLLNDQNFAAIFKADTSLTTVFNDRVWAGKHVSLGLIPARLLSETDINWAIIKSEALAETNKSAVKLRSIDISAFPNPETYLVIPKKMDEKYKKLIMDNFEQARKDGDLEALWNKWISYKKLPDQMQRD